MKAKCRIFAALSVAMLLFGCGTEDSAGPVSAVSNEQYVFAANNANPGEIIRYTVSSGALDTLDLGTTLDIACLSVSRQRGELLVAAEDKIHIVNISSFAQVDEIAEAEVDRIEISPSGSFVTFYHDPTLEIYRLAGRQFLRSENVNVEYGHTNGSWALSDTSYVVLAIDPAHGPNEYYIPVLGGPSTIASVQWLGEYDMSDYGFFSSQREFYGLEFSSNAFSQFQVFDLDLDSMIFWLAVPSPSTHAAITPNRNRVYVTASEPPPLHGPGQQASGTIWEYDFEANTVTRTINTYNIPVDSGAGLVDISWVAVTPDGRHLIGMSQYAGGYLLDYNLQTYQVNRLLDLGETGEPWIMSN